MTTDSDFDAALGRLGLTRSDLPPAVADTVQRHLEDTGADMGDLIRSEVTAIPDRRIAVARRIFGDNADEPDPPTAA